MKFILENNFSTNYEMHIKCTNKSRNMQRLSNRQIKWNEAEEQEEEEAEEKMVEEE